MKSLEAMAAEITELTHFAADAVPEQDEIQVHTSANVVWSVSPVYRTSEWAITSRLLDRYGEEADYSEHGTFEEAQVVARFDELTSR